MNFPSRGNEAFAHKQSKLSVKFVLVPDDCFRRKGNDLIYIHKLTLEDAIKAEPIRFRHLDGRQMTVTID